ncbi:MAG: HAD family hydrolase [Niabella sp.]
MKTTQLILIFLFVLTVSCKNDKSSKQPTETLKTTSQLPSFNEGAAKQNIINFVNAVTDSASPDFVPVQDRIVCFDNDGTLWAEQPLPNQVYFTFDRIKELAKTNPELGEKQPFKAVIENDMETIKKFHTEDLLALVTKVNSVTKTEELDKIVNDWFATAQHPILKKPYDKVVYQPMLELLDYLRANQFKIFIVSGGSVEFMRPFTQRVYGVSTENVIGSRMKMKAVRNDAASDSLYVSRLPEFVFNDDKEGKVVSIQEFIGKKPIMVVGNSDGDLAMMEYAALQDRKTLMVYLKHTDGEREFDYSKGVIIGTLKDGEEVAKKGGWTIIDMKTDWNTVFPIE